MGAEARECLRQRPPDGPTVDGYGGDHSLPDTMDGGVVTGESVDVAERVRLVRERMKAAQSRSPIARRTQSVALVAATKGASLAQVHAAVDAGVDAIGESRVQELTGKFGAWRPPVPCHFIGRLQRNKVRLALQWCDMIQSVDSLPLAEMIQARHLELRAPDGSSMRQGRAILVQVNVAGEATKGGFAPEALEAVVERMATWPGLAVKGLMAIPPYTVDPEAARPYFRTLRALAERVAARGFAGVSMATVSMGMSHDFEVAIEEGATMIRIGTALFGARPV
jgi:pyridoxal phosphate enzyme (YggS family)